MLKYWQSYHLWSAGCYACSREPVALVICLVTGAILRDERFRSVGCSCSRNPPRLASEPLKSTRAGVVIWTALPKRNWAVKLCASGTAIVVPDRATGPGRACSWSEVITNGPATCGLDMSGHHSPRMERRTLRFGRSLFETHTVFPPPEPLKVERRPADVPTLVAASGYVCLKRSHCRHLFYTATVPRSQTHPESPTNTRAPAA